MAQELEQIFREHYQLVYRTAYRVTGSAEDAEDVLQTIFLRLLRREFPPDLKKNPKAYLYRAAVNSSLDTIRSRQRRALTDVAEQLAGEVTHDVIRFPHATGKHSRLNVSATAVLVTLPALMFPPAARPAFSRVARSTPLLASCSA